MMEFFLGIIAGLVCIYLTLEFMVTLAVNKMNKYLKEKEGSEE